MNQKKLSEYLSNRIKEMIPQEADAFMRGFLCAINYMKGEELVLKKRISKREQDYEQSSERCRPVEIRIEKEIVP